MSSRIRAWEPSLQAAPVGRRAVLLSGLALPLGLALAGAAPASALQRAARPVLTAQTPQTAQTAQMPRLTLPAPTGRHRLGTVSLYLIDKSRRDPWVPSIPFRGLMTQIWYPAHAVDGYPRVPYMTPATARAYEKEQGIPALNWPITHARLGALVRRRAGGWPVVLYSPGLGDERFLTTCLVEDLASHGYVVVTIDHIHDSGVVVLPDGRVEAYAVPPLTNANQIQISAKEVESRVVDVRFILDQLAVISRGGNPGHEPWPLPRGLRGALDLGRVGMFGHSDGGSTTAHAMHVDARIKAGVDMDGTFWTPQAVAGSDRPLLLFGEQDLAPLEASTWAEFWKHQRGPKLQLSLKGSKHATFTDFAALVPQVAPILGEPPSWVIKGIGTINGERAVTVERAYLGAWFGMYLRHQHSHLLTGPSPRYPEVRFVR